MEILYRAVDKNGHTIDFLFTAKRDKTAAKTSAGTELIRMIRKGQMAKNSNLPLYQQFEALAS